jgi:hypothetical protein
MPAGYGFIRGVIATSPTASSLGDGQHHREFPYAASTQRLEAVFITGDECAALIKVLSQNRECHGKVYVHPACKPLMDWFPVHVLTCPLALLPSV